MSEEFQVTKHDPNKEKIMPISEHLEELRGHIIRGVVAILLIAIVVFIFKDFVFNKIIFAPKEKWFFSNRILCKLSKELHLNTCINKNSIKLINIDIAGQFTAHIKVSFILGLIISFPYLLWEIWLFVKPALHIKTRISIVRTMFFISLLFLIGVLFGYYVIVPLTLNFLTNYQVSSTLTNQIDFQSYISVVLTLSFSTGLVFELPILIYFLSKIGILNTDFLKKQRKIAIVLAFGLAAIITPPDAFSQILVAIPLIILYEVGIAIAKAVEKKRTIIME